MESGIGAMVACCAVTGATGALTGKTTGIAGVVHTGPGDYAVTLADGGIDLTNGAPSVALSGAVEGNITWQQTTDTALQILTWDNAGVAADLDFQLFIERIGIG